ncbi:aminodeoxychorismate/anthranilate synthase component II [Desulfallas sp. Bu1-1]|uniref:anthranilate synthase component II n=1 Tax=Desulfallas sp. Bu1-1 TaxID=2787620 RepID=UPI00189E9866|nr:aminodeoxychorismate/anthranilate synthase component II [Desulfallas sp. Bu1-1]MBF7082223.1 aminodeoxychorismate/anthranilate synthase component II [Desulfallas sp. Bu1-1]
MILLIDNYDSFVYNLYQYLSELGKEVNVYRNDEITAEDVEEMAPECIILSPGPCTPDEAGVCLELVSRLSGKIPIFGVCLGHQVIGQALGGKVVRAPRPVHGKTSWITHTGRGIYSGLPNPMQVGRYHSLVLENGSLPGCLEITARTVQGEIMGVRHRRLPVEGVQFHPESILTTYGKKLLANYLQTIKGDMLYAG